MSMVVEAWERFECPVPSGIYFPDDYYFPMNTLSPAACRSIVPTVEGLSDLDVGDPIAEDDRYLVYGGETSWEGDGYLALVYKADSALIWLIHAVGSEPFLRAELQSDCIFAVSSEYPFTYEWRIPIDAPQKLSVDQLKEN